ncbi:MAG: hypothetical protein AB7E75_02360 [Candidatus Methanomethylophilaceae archaeon]
MAPDITAATSPSGIGTMVPALSGICAFYSPDPVRWLLYPLPNARGRGGSAASGQIFGSRLK